MRYTISEQHNAVATIFSGIEQNIEKDIAKSKFNCTNTILYYKCKKADLLLNSLNSIGDNYYVSQVIMRVIFEEYLVGHYIWVRNKIEGTDACGEDYKIYYLCAEMFKRENYNISVENIQNSIKSPVPLDSLKLKYPELSTLEQKDVQDIHLKASQFDVRKIGKYLKENGALSEGYQEAHNLMLNFLNRYNYLSSFVHGGPASEMKIFLDEHKEERRKVLEENISWGKIVSKQMKTNLIAILYDEFQSRYMMPLKQIIELSY